MQIDFDLLFGVLGVALFLIILIVVGNYTAKWVSRRIGFRRGKLVWCAGAIYLATRLLSFDRPNLVENLYYSVMSAIGEVAIISAAVIFISLWRPSPTHPRVLALDRDALRDRISSIINREFLTALTESLPRGAHDSENGLDYIPFLLKSIRMRRDRFVESSRRFLFLTVGIGLVSAAIVAAFGWIILQDESAGAPRALGEASDSLKEIEVALRNYEAGYRQSSPFLDLMKATSDDSGAKNIDLKQTMKKALENPDLGISELLVEMRTSAAQLYGDDEQERLYKESVLQAIAKFEKWQLEQSSLVSQLQVSQSQLEDILPRLKEGLGKDDMRLAELFRRLAIGIVVVTFFLVLVRFFSQLYKSDYAQVLRADLDDVFVRGFYVSYKAAEGNDVQRSNVLTTFLSAISSIRSETNAREEKSGATKEELEILKEVIGALTKKL